MKSTEKFPKPPLACFNIENLKYFHTGDINAVVIPDSAPQYNSKKYARIRFHLTMDFNPESTISTLIEYTEPFTYEYMESFVCAQVADPYPLTIDTLRFIKMELESNEHQSHELVYYFKVLALPSNDRSHYSTGLVIGRFQPVHLGHLYLFKKALEIVDCLKIGVGSSQMHHQPKNPFSYEERKNFIINALTEESISPSRYHIYPIPDVFDFGKWINGIFESVKEFDAIITNNLWIGRLIQQREKALIYGLKYNMAIYNGTRIRTLLHSGNEEWKNLVPDSEIPFLESWKSKNRL